MKTRKEISDKGGGRSVYVIEYLTKNCSWCKYWDADSFDKYKDAVAAKEKAYMHCKSARKFWTRKRFRVALYMRAE